MKRKKSLVYEIILNEKALKDLKKLDRTAAARIINKIEKDLSKEPPAGKLLSGDLRGLFSYRVGDYRVIYSKTRLIVTVLTVGYRREVYKYQEGL